MMKQNRKVEATPGSDRGNVIRNSVPIREAPSIRDASSSSTGMASKNAFRSIAATGIKNARYASDNPNRLSSRPRRSMIMNIGRASRIAGNICVISSATIDELRPGKRNRASTNAAIAPRTDATNAVPIETKVEFQIQPANPDSWKTTRYGEKTELALGSICGGYSKISVLGRMDVTNIQ